jgi:hypothetical protein
MGRQSSSGWILIGIILVMVGSGAAAQNLNLDDYLGQVQKKNDGFRSSHGIGRDASLG